MRVGICAWAFDRAVQGRRPLAEMTAAAARAGFAALEAAHPIRAEETGHADGPAAAADAVPVTSLATLALHRFALTDPRPERRRAAVAAVRGTIAAAAGLGAASVSFSPGPTPASDGLLDEAAAVLSPLVTEARAAGVAVAVENLPGHLLATRAATARLLDAVDGLGLCLDLGNALADPPVEAWLDRFAGRLVKLHLADGRIEGDRLRPAEPGRGEVPWAGLRPRLRGLPAGVGVFLETPPRAGPQALPEAAALARHRRAVREVLGCA